MKALLIAESEHILNSYNNFFIKNGYDTICYNWLLKALDNVGEICPHVVLINSIDYPRHWKTLVQYIRSDSATSDSTIILVTTENFDENERKKAEILDVHCVLEDVNSQEIIEKLFALLHLEKAPPVLAIEKNETSSIDSSLKMNSIEQEPILTDTTNSNDAEIDPSITRFAFNHPHTQALITGIVEHYNHPTLVFRPSSTDYFQTIRFGKKIEDCILTFEGIDSRISVQVQGIDDRIIEFCIIK